MSCGVLHIKFELAAKEAADTITHPRDNDAPVRAIQITLRSDSNTILLRQVATTNR